MEFGTAFICHSCRKSIDGNYHRYYSTMAGMDLEFYTHPGVCNEVFRGKYVDQYAVPEPINSRFEILDI
jgi:hypothetical protein